MNIKVKIIQISEFLRAADEIIIYCHILLCKIFWKCGLWHISFNRVAMEYWTSAFHLWNVYTAIIYTPSSCCSSSAITSRSAKFVIHTWLLRKGSRRKKPKRCLNWLTKWNKNISMLYQVMWFYLCFSYFFSIAFSTIFYLFFTTSLFFICPCEINFNLRTDWAPCP